MSGGRAPNGPISLSGAAAELATLRAGTASPLALIQVAHAAEHALRRLLRDDPTAPPELRLRALAPEELPRDALLAELRRRDRIPVELAAGVHELAAAAARAGTGALPEPRDAARAVAVADALEAHLRHRPDPVGLEDPLLAEVTDAPLATEDRAAPDRAVPPDVPARGARWIITLAGVLAVILLAAWMVRRASPDRALRRADDLADAGRTAAAAAVLQGQVEHPPHDPRAAARLARIYREAGRPVEALRALRAGLAAAPADARLNEELGLLLLELRRPPEAVRAFRAALLADSTSERAWVGLTRALREGGDVTAAERLLARAPEGARVLAGPPAPPAPAADTLLP